MPRRRSLWIAALASPLLAAPSLAPGSPPASRLPILGPAPPFVLVSAHERRVALPDLRGKVLAVTFVFTTCSSSCPVLTAKLAAIGRALGSEFGTRYAFVAISVDPLNDTPARLRRYAEAFDANAPGWYFLTGPPGDIADVVRRYGAYARRSERGQVEHLFLTSLIDRAGLLRVQYLGTSFDSDELLRDLQALAAE